MKNVNTNGFERSMVARRRRSAVFRPLAYVLCLLVAPLLIHGSTWAQKTDWPIVLPEFQNATGDAEYDWLATGLPEAMRNKLHGTIHIRALTFEEIGSVVARDPSLAGEYLEIARRLRSDLLIQGSYRVVDETIENAARCIDPLSGRPLTAFRSMGSVHNPPAVLNDLIIQLVRALRIAIPADQLEAIQRSDTEIVDAFSEHAKGLQELSQEGGSTVGALERFQAAVGLDPNYAAPHYRIAQLTHRLGDVDGAEKAYRAALRADIDHRDARYELGMLLIALDRKSEAMTELEQALKQAPEDPKMQTALSSIWFDQQQANFNQMADALRQAIAASPDELGLYVQLGDIYEKLGRLPDARDQYKIALQKSATHADAAYKLGIAERRMQNYKEAIKWLNVAVENNSSEKRAAYYLGQLLSSEGDLERAASAYKKAAEIEPNHSPTYLESGDVLARLGKHQDALLAYNKYANINKHEALPHLHIGRQYLAMGLEKQAMTAFEKSIEVDPRFTEGHIAIGELYERRKLTFRAADKYREAL